MAKATYTRIARQTLKKCVWRKLDIDSEISNATAIGCLTHSLTLIGLSETFDRAYEAAERQLGALQKASVTEWRGRKDTLDTALALVQTSLTALEEHVGSNEAKTGARQSNGAKID